MVDVSVLFNISPIKAELGLSIILLSSVAIVNQRRHDRVLNSDSKTPSTNVDNRKDDKAGDNNKAKGPAYMDTVLGYLYLALSATFLLDLGLISYRAYDSRSYNPTLPLAAKVLAWIAFSSNRRSILSNKSGSSPWTNHVICWIALLGYSLLAKPLFYYAWNLAASGVLFEKRSKIDPWGFLTLAKDVLEQVQIGTFVFRYALLWLVSLLSALHLSNLLESNDLKVPATLFHSWIPTSTLDETKITPSQKRQLKRLEEDEKAQVEALRSLWPKIKLAVSLSYPRDERRLQLLLILNVIIIVIERAINLLVPLQTERILRGFTNEEGEGLNLKISKFNAWSVLLFIMYRYLQRSTSILAVIRRVAQDPVRKHSKTSTMLRLFEHLHSMSVQFHMDHKSNELMHIMRNGVNAMQSISATVLFNILPTAADVFIAFAYFWVAWGWKYGLIVTFNSGLYLVISSYVTKTQTKLNRAWIEAEDGSTGRALESLANYETVKQFATEAFEVSQYRAGCEKSSKNFNFSLVSELLSMLGSSVWTINTLLGCMLCAYEISRGERDASSFMTFVIYTQQLESPVDRMAAHFNQLRRSFVSMEKVLRVLEEEPTVKDIPNAEPLIVTDGEVVFDNVSFQYDSSKKGLSNISFKALKGQTVAIVGPTGSGKSTLLRLTLRFWDPTKGRILIDGHNIAEKIQQSVRTQIGVVPQETFLFDDSIEYNIHYGRVTASKQEIVEAAKAAEIHDSIMKFGEGYETTVGDRGTKLSGGEKQRVSLARAILKNPPIMLLDEATSALDSATESRIQTSLASMTKNRTTIVVAHRLSTIMHADLILVLQDGEIVERGSHKELIQKALDNGGEGEYYKMWQLQVGGSSDASAPAILS